MKTDIPNGTFMFKFELYQYVPKINSTISTHRSKRVAWLAACATPLGRPACMGLAGGLVWGAISAYNAPPGQRLDAFNNGFQTGFEAGFAGGSIISIGKGIGRKKRSIGDECSLLRSAFHRYIVEFGDKIPLDKFAVNSQQAGEALKKIDINNDSYLELEEISPCLLTTQRTRRCIQNECPSNSYGYTIQTSPVYYVPSNNVIYI
jgi:hypothetical protein